MSITKTYNEDTRGQLIVVTDDQIAPVFSKSGDTIKSSGEVIDGVKNKKDTIVGTATGYYYNDGKASYVEVLRVGEPSFFGIPDVSIIYLQDGIATVRENPDYDPAKDTTAPNQGGGDMIPPYDNQTTTGKPDVSDKPGPGRIPVVGSDGKTVYVLLNVPETIPPTSDTTKKWLTYGLYGVLGLAVITIMVILVISLSKPKKKP